MTAMLAFLTALGPLSTDMYLPSLPDIADRLDADIAKAQLTLSVFLIGFVPGQVLYGPLSDALGRKPVLLGGLALFIAASVACALAPTIGVLLVGRFMQAVGAAGPIILARAIVRDLYEGPRAGRELSRMGTIMGLVPAVAPILGGVLQTAFGWRASFWVGVLAGLALGACAAALLPETRPRTGQPVSLGRMATSFRILLADGRFRLNALLVAVTYAGLFCFISASSFVLQGVYGLTEVAYGFAFALMVVGYILGTIVAQRVVGRLGLEGTIAVGTAILAAGGASMLALVAGGVQSWLAVGLPMAGYAFGVGLVMPQALAAAMGPFPQIAGAASSLVGIVQSTLAACVGAVLGASLDGAHAWPLPLSVALLGATAFILGRLRPAA
jgi:DHA1 family bicyclomycin/chloramphenicol resistance-like MFS transporter